MQRHEEGPMKTGADLSEITARCELIVNQGCTGESRSNKTLREEPKDQEMYCRFCICQGDLHK